MVEMSEAADTQSLDSRLAARLRALRSEHALSLDVLAARSGVSRATLSRLENGEVSPTASVLNKLCHAYGLTMSRLMRMVEEAFAAHLPREAQPVWQDPEGQFLRRSVSPPSQALAAEVIEVDLGPGTVIDYDETPRPGLEHHLILKDGRLTVTVGGTAHGLMPGDCLRYQLFGPSRFETPEDAGAHYFLVMV